ncbi:hypothetical protein R3P38DRAFT_2779680 [Favolaschia claudopus]|uniref:Uncharacterized protein n=1 Tax=Favolaschia claudopus TaxID=2862362 RepID=A0AAW0BF25_9AGAR
MQNALPILRTKIIERRGTPVYYGLYKFVVEGNVGEAQTLVSAKDQASEKQRFEESPWRTGPILGADPGTTMFPLYIPPQWNQNCYGVIRKTVDIPGAAHPWYRPPEFKAAASTGGWKTYRLTQFHGLLIWLESSGDSQNVMYDRHKNRKLCFEGMDEDTLTGVVHPQLYGRITALSRVRLRVGCTTENVHLLSTPLQRSRSVSTTVGGEPSDFLHRFNRPVNEDEDEDWETAEDLRRPLAHERPTNVLMINGDFVDAQETAANVWSTVMEQSATPKPRILAIARATKLCMILCPTIQEAIIAVGIIGDLLKDEAAIRFETNQGFTDFFNQTCNRWKASDFVWDSTTESENQIPSSSDIIIASVQNSADQASVWSPNTSSALIDDNAYLRPVGCDPSDTPQRDVITATAVDPSSSSGVLGSLEDRDVSCSGDDNTTVPGFATPEALQIVQRHWSAGAMEDVGQDQNLSFIVDRDVSHPSCGDVVTSTDADSSKYLLGRFGSQENNRRRIFLQPARFRERNTAQSWSQSGFAKSEPSPAGEGTLEVTANQFIEDPQLPELIVGETEVSFMDIDPQSSIPDKDIIRGYASPSSEMSKLSDLSESDEEKTREEGLPQMRRINVDPFFNKSDTHEVLHNEAGPWDADPLIFDILFGKGKYGRFFVKSSWNSQMDMLGKTALPLYTKQKPHYRNTDGLDTAMRMRAFIREQFTDFFLPLSFPPSTSVAPDCNLLVPAQLLRRADLFFATLRSYKVHHEYVLLTTIPVGNMMPVL